jgi:hypothetical protein
VIKPASLQHPYSLIWSRDPSLALEWYVDVETLTDEQNAEARAKIDKERDRLFRVARQTSNWSSITKPGEQPTTFTFRQLGHNDLAWVQGEAGRNQLGQLEINDLFFLLAIESVSNFGAVEVKRSKGSKLADAKILNEISTALNSVIADGCALLVAEFVEHIIARARGAIDPLS